LAGPIIEREQIDLVCDFGRWMTMHGKHQQYSRPSQSPLIAAMPAYIMWEYGDEVPDGWRRREGRRAAFGAFVPGAACGACRLWIQLVNATL
jgi:hypothetical protein